MVIFPPKGMDPDDWAKAAKGTELSDRIARAVPLMETIERAASRKYDLSQISGKLSYLRLMGKYLPWITDIAEQRLYVQRVAHSAGLPEETVLAPLRGRGEAAAAAPGLPGRRPAGRPEEGLLLSLLSRDPSLIEEVRRDEVLGLIEGEEIREAVDLLSRRSEAGGRTDLNGLLDAEISEAARRRISEEIVRAEMSAGEARRIYPDVVLGLKIRKLDREIVRLGEAYKASIGAGDRRRAQELLQAQIAAKREKERLDRERNDASMR